MASLADIRSKKVELEAIGAQYGVSNIRVFGSVARGDATEKSDVDLLITFDYENYTGFDLGGFQYQSSEALDAHVDVVMDHHIHKALKENILQEARPI